eukprot:s2996_g9.t1
MALAYAQSWHPSDRFQETFRGVTAEKGQEPWHGIPEASTGKRNVQDSAEGEGSFHLRRENGLKFVYGGGRDLTRPLLQDSEDSDFYSLDRSVEVLHRQILHLAEVEASNKRLGKLGSVNGKLPEMRQLTEKISDLATLAAEEKLSLRAQASLDALGSLCPETVRRLDAHVKTLADAEQGREVRVLDLRAGDRIFVRAGEVVPVDGRIIDGHSQVGMSHMTGEPLPQAVRPGNSVSSGATLIDGALLLEVQREAGESTLQRLAKLTSSAKASRPKLVTLVDAVAERWSFAVVISTALVAALPPLLFRAPLGRSVYHALVWLITASPCALILSTPLVYLSGLSVAARNGVLLKGGRTLDALAVASGVAFDKTGTLTTGTPEVVDSESAHAKSKGEHEVDALLCAASLGRLSVHPVSRAAVAALPEDKDPLQVTGFQMVAGEGVTGNLRPNKDGRSLSCEDPLESLASLTQEVGEAATNRAQFESVPCHQWFECLCLEQPAKRGAWVDVELSEALVHALRSRAAKVAKTGSVVMALSVWSPDEEAQAWLFHFEEPIESRCRYRVLGSTLEAHEDIRWSPRPSLKWLSHSTQRFVRAEDSVKEAASAVVAEVSRGGPVYMLTGDRHANARSVVDEVGAANFDAVHADLRPEDKLEKVRLYDTLLRETAGKGSWQARLLGLLGVSLGGLVMVGDGVNDAPALAAATAGISLEAQTDGALQSNAVDGSDALILRRASDPRGDSDLKRVAWLLALAQKTRNIILQNLCLAGGSILGASSVTLFTGMPLWLGVLLHEGTTMLVGLNSLRLFSSLRSTWRPPFSRYRRKH